MQAFLTELDGNIDEWKRVFSDRPHQPTSAQRAKYGGEMFTAGTRQVPRRESKRDRRFRSSEVVAMIKNEREYRVTRAQAARFEQALAELARVGSEERLHPLLEKAQRESLQSQMGDLREQMAEYEDA